MFRIIRAVIGLVLCAGMVYGEGRMDTVNLPTLSARNNRPVIFYLPEGYDNDTVRYPVLFLLHGINGDEYSWPINGNVKHVLDSMIAQQIVRPCVVVMPNTNAGTYIWGKRYKGMEDNRGMKTRSLTSNLFGYFKNREGNFLDYFYEIETLTYARYRVSEQAADRIVAGLSNGSYQAAAIANMQPGCYSWVGLLSPVIFDKQVPEPGEDWCITPELPEGTRFFVSIGEGDIFRSYGVHYIKQLRKRHIPCVVVSGKGGHNWKVWRNDFATFMRYAFPFAN